MNNVKKFVPVIKVSLAKRNIEETPTHIAYTPFTYYNGSRKMTLYVLIIEINIAEN